MSASKKSFLKFIQKFENNHLSLHFEIEFLDRFIENIKSNPISVIFLYNHGDFSKSFCSCLTQKFLDAVNFLAWDISDWDDNQELYKELRNVSEPNNQVVDEFLLDCITAARSSVFLFAFKNNRFVLQTYITNRFDLTEFVIGCCNERTGIDCDIFYEDTIMMDLGDLNSFGLNVEENLQLALIKSQQEEKLLLIYFHNEQEYFSKNFWKVVKNKDANIILNKFIFHVIDPHSLDNILPFMEMMDLRVDFQTFNGLLVIQFDERSVKLRETIAGNINEQVIMIRLYDAHEIFENDKKTNILCTEINLYHEAVEKFRANFKNSNFSFETHSLKNAFDKYVFKQPEYLRKVVIICLYSENSFSNQELFSNLLKCDDLKTDVSLLSHFVLWNINHHSNIDVFKKIIRDMHFDETIYAAIEASLDAREERLFLFQTDDESIANLLMVIKEESFDLENLKDIFNHYNKYLIDKFEITDLYEVQAFKNIPVSLDYKNCNQTLRRVLCEMQDYPKKAEVLALNFCKEENALRAVFKSLPENTKLITWDTKINPEKLVLAVDHYFENEEIKTAIKKNSKTNFMFVSTGDGIILLKDKRFLNNMLEFINTPLEDDETSPFVFQQKISDNLGNRDFNLFDLEKEGHSKYLDDWVGFALFGTPQDAEKKYEDKQNELISKMVEKIKSQVIKFSPHQQRILVACVYNCFIHVDEGIEKFSPRPVIAVQKCVNAPGRSCRIYIDSDLRVYSSWSSYLDENNLDAGFYIVPQDGIYQEDCFGKVRLEFIVNKKLGRKIINGIDKASIAVGLGSAAVGIAALIPAITIAPVVAIGAAAVGAGTGIYSVVRSATNLADRSTHDESLHITNPQARAAYLNITAGVFSFATAGATAAISQFARNGGNIGKVSQVAFNCLTGANIVASGGSITNSIADVIYNWKVHGQEPDSLVAVQLVASILFFGHSIYNVKSAGTIINESQQQAILDIENSLKSNRQRKTFRKLTKDSVRIKGGNQQAGLSEVIYHIKNLDNRDEIIAILTRNNKRLNKANIKFAVDKNKIVFNGNEVNLKTFSELKNIENSMVFKDSPAMRDFKVMKLSDFKFPDASTIANVALTVGKIWSNLCEKNYNILIQTFSSEVSNMLIKYSKMFLEEQLKIDANIFSKQILPSPDGIFKMVLDYFITSAHELAKEKLKGKPRDIAFNFISFIEKAVWAASLSVESLIRHLMQFSITWLAKNILDYFEDKEIEDEDHCIECKICNGKLRSNKWRRKNT